MRPASETSRRDDTAGAGGWSAPQAEAPSPSLPSPPAIAIPELGETLRSLRITLEGNRNAAKFGWISGRLMVLRNVIIATVVVAATLTVVSLLVREAFRQTLTITSFDVPASVAERGITGEVVARNLFNELLKRRKTITTFDAGNLSSVSGERQNDIASTDGKFSLQSIFRYLRHLTGRETTISGEMLIAGEQITLTGRVSGHPQKSVKGSLADWESLLGELANHVFDATQPVVLAGYLGETAKTPDDLVQLSKLIRRMLLSSPATPDAAMALAYHAYGTALRRQDRIDEALAAWAQARDFDPGLASAYLSAARVLRQSDPALGERLFREGLPLERNRSAKLRALFSRFYAAMDTLDCVSAQDAVQQADALGTSRSIDFAVIRASYMDQCEYRQAEAVVALQAAALRHADFFVPWQALGGVQQRRPDRRFLAEARAAQQQALNVSPKNPWEHMHLAMTTAMLGLPETAQAVYDAGLQLSEAADLFPILALAQLRLSAGDPAHAERVIRPLAADPLKAHPWTFRILGQAEANQGGIDKALATLQTGQARFPKACTLYDTAGALLLKAGRDDEAFAHWQAGVRAVPKCDVTYLHHAQALIERGRGPEARKLLETLVKVSPGSDGAEMARPLLARMGTQTAGKP